MGNPALLDDMTEDRRSSDELERQIRRSIVERALKDFREDQQAFGCEP